MRSFEIQVLFLYSWISSSCLYYIPVSDSSGVGSKSYLFSPSVQLDIPTNTTEFPTKFRISFTADQRHFSYLLVKTEGLINKPALNDNIYIKKNESLDPVLVKLEDEISVEFYKSDDNTVTATLMLNSDLHKNGIATDTKYRALVTIIHNDTQYDCVPILIERKVLDSRDGYITRRLSHQLQKTKIKNINYGKDYISKRNVKESKYQYKAKSKISKRSVNGVPVTLYVECLIVADYSVFLKQKKYLNTANDSLCLQYMKIYYSHLLAAADQRYANSLDQDPDLKIKLRVKNFLFLTSSTAVNWASYPNTTIIDYPTYNGRDVVVAVPTLSAFTTYMNAQSLPFTYDHAVGFLDKDIWSSTTTDTPDVRSIIVGYAWIAGICGINRYSIIEDDGFNSISVTAHEIGHNLGSIHDGDAPYATSCPASDNYIMTPTVGDYDGNYTSFFRFSNCSISQFKKTLLASNGSASTTAQCLTNVPLTYPIESTYFNTSMNGQMWSSNDQCKLIIGPNSTYCPITTLADMCHTLWCVLVSPNCAALSGWGAIDGTPCGTGLVCKESKCVSNSVTLVPNFASNPCAINPCKNGGACTKVSYFYICTCKPGFYGINCEIISNATSTIPTSTTVLSTLSSSNSTTTTTTLSSSNVSSATTTTSSSLNITNSTISSSSITTSSNLIIILIFIYVCKKFIL